MHKIALLVAAGGLLATQAVAQTSTSPSQPSAPVVTTTPGAPTPAAPNVNTSTGAPNGTGVVDRNTGVAGAAGNRNQAVATTSANAPQPAKGANSFSAGEARRRLRSAGYTTISDLKKDGDGIWRGNAKKNGASVGVWLDYKGNVGQQ